MPDFGAMTQKIRPFACLAATLMVAGGPTLAETPPSPVLRAELIDGWQMQSGHEMAALRLVLAPGWKTYWRAPGEAGVPPRFDWAGSQNLKGVTIHWPRPEIFDLNGMRTFGYHDGLVLPIELTPGDPSAPIRLKADVELGICKEICVPMELTLTGDVQPGGDAVPEIRRALSDQPEQAQAAGLSAATCSAEPIRDGMRLTTALSLPEVGPDEVTVVELADPSVWVSSTETVRKGGMLQATADLVPASAKPFALDRSSIHITIFGGNGRVVELQGCAG